MLASRARPPPALAPLAGLILKGHDAHAHRKPSALARLIQPLGFNAFFDTLSDGYATMTRWVVRRAATMLVVYAVLIAAAIWTFTQVARGFVPAPTRSISSPWRSCHPAPH